jgi:cell division protein FtsA
MNSIENKTQSAVRIDEIVKSSCLSRPVVESHDRREEEEEEVETRKANNEESTGDKIKIIFDRYVDKIKDFFR